MWAVEIENFYCLDFCSQVMIGQLLKCTETLPSLKQWSYETFVFLLSCHLSRDPGNAQVRGAREEEAGRDERDLRRRARAQSAALRRLPALLHRAMQKQQLRLGVLHADRCALQLCLMLLARDDQLLLSGTELRKLHWLT